MPSSSMNCPQRTGDGGSPQSDLEGSAVSEPDRPADQHDVDAAGVFLVDLEDLSDAAVLPVGGIGAGVLELEAVLDDPLARRFQARDELLRAHDEDDVGGAPGVGGELAAR